METLTLNFISQSFRSGQLTDCDVKTLREYQNKAELEQTIHQFVVDTLSNFTCEVTLDTVQSWIPHVKFDLKDNDRNVPVYIVVDNYGKNRRVTLRGGGITIATYSLDRFTDLEKHDRLRKDIIKDYADALPLIDAEIQKQKDLETYRQAVNQTKEIFNNIFNEKKLPFYVVQKDFSPEGTANIRIDMTLTPEKLSKLIEFMKNND